MAFVSWLFTLIALFFTASSDASVHKPVRVITSADINSKKGFVITEPGTYLLGEDIVYKPRKLPGKVAAAITIASSNVVLDLGSHRLSQYLPHDRSKQVPFGVAIVVPDLAPHHRDTSFAALRSIYITGDNAIISDFSMMGIRIFGHTQDIRLSNFTIKNIGHLASKALRPFADYFPHSSDLASYGPSFGVAGIAIGESAVFGMGPKFFTDTGNVFQNRTCNLNLEKISCLNCFCSGITVANATDISIQDCHFDRTFSDDPGNSNGPKGLYPVITAMGGDFTGADTMFEDPNILDMIVTNTTFNSTSIMGDLKTPTVVGSNPVASGFPAVGACLTKSRNITFQNCHFDNTSNSFAFNASINGGFTAGFAGGGIEDATFMNCSFDGTQGPGSVNGMHVSGTSSCGEPIKSSRNTQILHCTANNTKQIGDQLLVPGIVPAMANAGFFVAYAKDLTIDSCIGQDLIVNGPATCSTFSSGFYLAASANQQTPFDANDENVVVRNCVASHCKANNGGQAIGFFLCAPCVPADQEPLNATKGIIFENCVASGIETVPPTLTTSGIQQSVACGFFDLGAPYQSPPDEFRSWPASFVNCKALHNKGLPVVTLNGSSFYSAGFSLFGATKHSLFQCEADDNVYGVFLQLCSQCVVRNCRSDNNVDLVYHPGTGAGFTDLGVGTSFFSSNTAYNNGDGITHVGPNGNYNVFVNESTPLPLLQVQVSQPASSYTYSDPAFYTPVHNISTIQ